MEIASTRLWIVDRHNASIDEKCFSYPVTFACRVPLTNTEDYFRKDVITLPITHSPVNASNRLYSVCAKKSQKFHLTCRASNVRQIVWYIEEIRQPSNARAYMPCPMFELQRVF